MKIEPYLFFDGRCDEAIAFYTRALGAELVARMTYADGPQGEGCTPGQADQVMHAEVRVGDASFMLSDGMGGGTPRFEGFGVSLTAPDDATARRYFEALAEHGTTTVPFGPSFFSTGFGMVNDRFGVQWLVVSAKQP